MLLSFVIFLVLCTQCARIYISVPLSTVALGEVLRNGTIELKYMHISIPVHGTSIPQKCNLQVEHSYDPSTKGIESGRSRILG